MATTNPNMEYPGTKLTKKVRRIILALFFTAFFLISPILIMYTAGYRYDFQNGFLKEIGALSIDILPKNATVYLNDAKLNGKIPIRLKNIVPQKYQIKITADGYYDWSKEVTVKRKETVYIKEINLLKKSTPQLLRKGKIIQVAKFNNGNYLIWQINNGKKQDFFLYDLNNNTETFLYSDVNGQNYQINWAEKNPYAIITAASAPYKKIFIMNAARPQDSWIYTFNAPANKYQWQEGFEPEIFFSTQKEIGVLRPNSKQKFTIGKNNFLSWQAENGQVWTLQTTSSTTELKIIKDTFGFSSIFKILPLEATVDLNAPWEIINAHNDQLLIKKTDMPQMVLINQNQTYNFTGEKFLLSPYNDWWIMWTPWEITTYSKGETPYLLNRSGENLHKIIPLDKYNTLLLIWENKSTVLYPYYLVSHDLITQKINDVAADSENRILYFAGMINGEEGLYKLEY